jgi:hypothetical protein
VPSGFKVIFHKCNVLHFRRYTPYTPDAKPTPVVAESAAAAGGDEVELPPFIDLRLEEVGTSRDKTKTAENVAVSAAAAADANAAVASTASALSGHGHEADSSDAPPEGWQRFEPPRGAALATPTAAAVSDPFSDSSGSPPGGHGHGASGIQRTASDPTSPVSPGQELGRAGGGGGGASYPLCNPFSSTPPAAAAVAREPNMDHREFEDLMKHLADV